MHFLDKLLLQAIRGIQDNRNYNDNSICCTGDQGNVRYHLIHL